MPDPRDVQDIAGCEQEIQAFARAGVTGLTRLKQVLASVFMHYGIHNVDEQVRLLKRMGFRTYVHSSAPHGTHKWASFLIDYNAENTEAELV